MSFGKDKNRPKILYKYCSWESEFHRRMINPGEIFFSSPDRFNDPFDCRTSPDYSRMTLQQEYDRIRDVIGQDRPDLASDDLEMVVKEWFALHPFTSPAAQEIEIRVGDEGVFSVAEVPDSILMWSYYADKHRGFCVGFDVARMEGMFDLLCEFVDIYVYLHKVDYRTNYPCDNPAELTDEEYFKTVLTVKSRDWDREREWRWIIYDQTDYKIVLPRGCITEVIAGCSMSLAAVGELGRELVSAGFRGRFSKAEKLQRKFGLRLTPISHCLW